MAAAAQILAVDIGDKRSGVARASSVARLAEPLESVATDKLVDFLNQFSKDHQLEAIVIGLPRNLKGEETAQSQVVREWIAKNRDQISEPLFWQDETLSTLTANSQPPTAKADEHAGAAAVILQDFLDSPIEDRVGF